MNNDRNVEIHSFIFGSPDVASPPDISPGENQRLDFPFLPSLHHLCFRIQGPSTLMIKVRIGIWKGILSTQEVARTHRQGWRRKSPRMIFWGKNPLAGWSRVSLKRIFFSRAFCSGIYLVLRPKCVGGW